MALRPFSAVRWASALALGAGTLGALPVHAAPDARQITTQGVNGAPACMTCHGANGEGNPAAGFPQLAGMGAAYLAEQLEAMANGSRVSPVMAATAKALDPAQRQAVAAYYAGLPSPLNIDRLAATARTTSKIRCIRGSWPTMPLSENVLSMRPRRWAFSDCSA